MHQPQIDALPAQVGGETRGSVTVLGNVAHIDEGPIFIEGSRLRQTLRFGTGCCPATRCQRLERDRTEDSPGPFADGDPAEASQDEPVYRYFFTHALSGPAGQQGAVHGLELFFVFQKLGLVPTYTASADDLAVEAALLGYWTRFAATGDPNGAGAPAWPEYQGAADPYLELAATPAAGEGVRTAKCDFWDALLP